MIDALQYGFMRNALMAGLLVSIAAGIIGSYVVLNRIVFISGGIAHAAYGGIGMGYYLGIDPVIGAIIFSLVAALGMGEVQRRTRERADTIIGAMWSIGMSVGIIFVDLARGYKADLLSFLFGSILAVPSGDLWLMLILDLIIVALVVLFYKELLAISFDETFATVENVPVHALYLMLVALIALSVVMMMRVVGLIMVIALLTMPAAIAGAWVRNMKNMMILACVLAVVFNVVGLWLSFTLNLTSGATIIMVTGVAYLISMVLKPALAHRFRQPAT